MPKQKLLLLFFILTLSGKCICQIGPTMSGGFGFGSGSSHGNGYNEISLLFTALNGTMSTMNIVNAEKAGKIKSSAGFGIVTGASQIAYGLIYKPETGRSEFIALNVGIGTVTILTSCYRLYKNSSKKNNATSLNLFCVPVKNNKMGVGVSLTRKI